MRISRSKRSERTRPAARRRAVSQTAKAYTATQAKNDFARLLEQAIHGEPVVITRHGAEKAVLMSAEKFRALRPEPEYKLERMRQEFDRLFASMQTPHFRKSISAAFHASPEEMGKAAVALARKRRHP